MAKPGTTTQVAHRATIATPAVVGGEWAGAPDAPAQSAPAQSAPAQSAPAHSDPLPLLRGLNWLTGEFARLDPAHCDATSQQLESFRATEQASKTDRLGRHRLALRKRFYAAQWLQLVRPKLESILHSRGLQAQWIGWQRSLPRLYLPPESLTRLMTEAMDAVACQILTEDVCKSPARRPLSIRVSGLCSGHSHSLVIVLEHPHWHCNRATQTALNSPSLLSSSDVRFDRVRRQAMMLGGSISVSPLLNECARGAGAVDGDSGSAGARMRIVLPIDQPRSLVRAWVDNLFDDSTASPMERDVYLFLVARSRNESPAQAMAADERLQALIDADGMLYRVDQIRWLWLRCSSQLPLFIRNHAWRTAQAAHWHFRGQVSSSGPGDGLRGQLTQTITATMQRIIGGAVPPLDRIVQGYEAPTANRAQVLNPRPHLQSRPTRWRYPI